MDKSLVTIIVWPLSVDFEVKKKSGHIVGPLMMNFQIKHLSKSLNLLNDIEKANDLQFPIDKNQDVSEEEEKIKSTPHHNANIKI